MAVDSLSLQELVAAQLATRGGVRAVAAVAADASVAARLPPMIVTGQSQPGSAPQGAPSGPLFDDVGPDQPTAPSNAGQSRNPLAGLEQVVTGILLNSPAVAAALARPGGAGTAMSEASARSVGRNYLRLDGDDTVTPQRGAVAEPDGDVAGTGRSGSASSGPVPTSAQSAAHVLTDSDDAARPGRTEINQSSLAAAPLGEPGRFGPTAPAELRVVVHWQDGARPVVVELKTDDDEAQRSAPAEDAATAPRRVSFEIETGAGGRVGVVLDAVAGRLAVTLTAQDREMAEALRASGDDLRRSLREASIALEALSIRDGRGSGDGAPSASVSQPPAAPDLATDTSVTERSATEMSAIEEAGVGAHDSHQSVPPTTDN